MSKKVRKEVWLAMQEQRDKFAPKEGSFADFVPATPPRETRRSQGWSKIAAHSNTLGFVRHTKDEDEVLYFEIPHVAGTLAEKRGWELAHISNDRALAIETARLYGASGSKVFMFGFNSYSRPPRYERALTDGSEGK